MANYDDAINGVSDDSQALYRRKAPGGIAGVPAFGSIASRNDPNQYGSIASRTAAPNPDTEFGAIGDLGATQRAARAYNSPASSAAERAGQLVRTGYNISQIPTELGARALGAGANAISGAIGDFTRGISGGVSLPSPISSAAAATPNNAAPPLQRQSSITQLPTMTVNGPAAATPPSSDVGSRVAIGRTFGTRAADGSVAFSNIPGQQGYDPGYNRAGDNINVVPSANFSNPGAGTGVGIASTPQVGAFTRPSNDYGFNMNPVDMANRQAISDVNAILSHDPRSALGTTARNLSVELSTNPSMRGRYGSGPSPYEQGISHLIGAVGASQAASVKQAEEQDRNATELTRTNLQGQNELARENARSLAEFNRPQYETDASGNLVRVSGTNAQPVTGADKNPLAVLGKINASEEKIYGQALANARNNGSDDPEGEAKKAVQGYRELQVRGGAQQPVASVGPQLAKAKDGTPLHLSADGKSWVTPDGKPYVGGKNG